MSIRRILLVLAFLLASGGAVSCSSSDDVNEERSPEKRNEARREVLQLVAKHDADVNWLSMLGKVDLFTVELQRCLLEPPGRSHLLLSHIADVMKQDDMHVLTAHNPGQDIYFLLECDREQVERVLHEAEEDWRLFRQYAIVWVPESVEKPLVDLTAVFDMGQWQIAHATANILVVKGQCVELLPIEGVAFEPSELGADGSGGSKQ